MRTLGVINGYQKYSNRIIKIKKVGKAKVFDIEVKETHRVLANGFYTSNCSHPDLIDFIKIKADHKSIQNANISVQCLDAFYKAVAKDKDWELKFEIPEVKKGQKIFIDIDSRDSDCHYDKETKKWYKVAKKNRKAEKIVKVVKSREILHLIAKYMCEHGEPGIQNIDLARKYSNSDYLYDPEDKDGFDSRIQGTNACSEQYLERSGNCILSAINTATFSVVAEEYEQQLSKISESIVRFLDNVNTVEVRDETYAVPTQRMAIEKLRRIGCGATDIAGWLFKHNLEYGSQEGNAAIAKFIEKYNYNVYKTSIALGAEKGSFKTFNREKYEKSPFVQRMMKAGLEFKTMRNCTCSTIAPNGTLSLMFRDLILGYGIEPAFGMYFWKRTRISGKYDYYFCVPSAVRQVFEKLGVKIPIDEDAIRDTWDGKLGKPIAEFIDAKAKELKLNFKKAAEIDAICKLDLMSQVMKSIDSSISTTFMLPEGTNPQGVYDFILAAHEKEVKSIAAFPDKKMYGIVSHAPFKELAVKLTQEGINIHDQNFSEEEIIELQQITGRASESINKNNAPRRPASLPCDIHHIKITKKLDKIRTFDYLVIVGLMGNDPYEVFVMENGFLDKKYNRGVVTRVKSGVYSVKFPDETEIKDVTDDTSDEEDVTTRLTSGMLRHGADVAWVVDQLERSKGDMWSFSRAIARALKCYIKDGMNTGNCPKCGGEMKRMNGCKVCQSCGDQKCD